MQLGKLKKADDIVQAIASEEQKKLPFKLAQVAAQEQAQAKQQQQRQQHVQIMIEEKLIVQLDKEGALKKLEVKGEMKLIIFDPDEAKIVLRTTGLKSAAFKSRLHPKINEASWKKDGLLALKEVGKGFPVGADNAPVILKWRMVSDDEKEIPISLNFWPTNEAGRSVVSLEYNVEKGGVVLRDVHIIVPCKQKDAPQVTHCDGHTAFDNKDRSLVWSIEEISDEKSKGSLEFNVAEVDSDSFYPLSVLFTSSELYSQFAVEAVVDSDSGQPVEHHIDSSLSVEKYTVEAE